MNAPVRRNVRRAPRNVREELLRRYGDAGFTPALGRPPTTQNVGVMGPIVEIKMRRWGDNVPEVWYFGPRPRLVFTQNSKRLWTVGTGFRFDGSGFHAGGPSGLQRFPIAQGLAQLARQRREYRRTHDGLDPPEFDVSYVERPAHPIVLGEMDAIVYQTDRNDGTCVTKVFGNVKRGAMEGDPACAAGTWTRDGWSEWEHTFEDEGVTKGRPFSLPLVCTDPTGTLLCFSGGTYTILNGWLAG